MSDVPPGVPQFSGLSAGSEFRLRHVFTEAEIDRFAEASGDTNPLHMDDAFARKAGFRGRVVHGMLCGALLSRVLGTCFPGPGTVWLAQNFRFLAPVYADNEIEIQLRVKHKSQGSRTLLIDVEVTKGDAQVVMAGEATVMVPSIQKQIPWQEMVVIVTGAGRGIGAGVARSLGTRKAHVVVNYLSDSHSAEQVAEDIRTKGGEAVTVPADVGTSDGIRTLFQGAMDHFGHVDGIVNNASPSIQLQSFMECAFEDVLRYHAVYVRSTLELTQLAVPGMREREFGRIVNVLTAGLLGKPPPEYAIYLSAKGALWGLSKAMAVDLGRWGITVNMVSPSTVITDQWADLSETRQRALSMRVPLQRLAQPDDVANAVLFLLGEEGKFLNGVNIPLTGGEMM